jgi:xanthine/uracil permease
MSMFKWDVVYDGKTPPPGESVGPMERLSWGRTAGLGAQHVVAMFGATFVFPIVMGLDANLAIMFSGICTILFLLMVGNRVPSYLGTSASFVAVFLALIFGYVLSWIADAVLGPITSVLPTSNGEAVEHDRISWANVEAADWIGFPSGTLADGVSAVHGPSFSLTFILLVLPGVIALVAENTGHVKAVAEMTGENLDPYMGRAIGADGVATAFASAFGGSPTTTYAENIGVMGATRVYSTAAYYVAAAVAILLGLCPKFGAIVNATPGGVLGGITVVLYGMIGLVGAKIWVENNVDFGNPVNMVGLAAGIIAGIGGVTLTFGDDFELGGIALGTILVIVFFHMVKGRGGHGSGAVTRSLSHPDHTDDAPSGGSTPR